MRKIKGILLFSLIMPLLVAFTKADNISNAVYIHNDKEAYSIVTQDQKLMQALDLMLGTSGEASRKAILGNNLSGKPVKILFKDLSVISPEYANFDALGWKDNGQLYIYINAKHKNSPPEALASLLSHEAVHQDETNSLDEETYAWTLEANVWLQMKRRNPDLNKLNPNLYPLVNRENTLGNMLIDANYTNKEIKNEVYTNPGYRGLPNHTSSLEEKMKFIPYQIQHTSNLGG